jgi:hypothetical protein
MEGRKERRKKERKKVYFHGSKILVEVGNVGSCWQLEKYAHTVHIDYHFFLHAHRGEGKLLRSDTKI